MGFQEQVSYQEHSKVSEMVTHTGAVVKAGVALRTTTGVPSAHSYEADRQTFIHAVCSHPVPPHHCHHLDPSNT